MNIEVTRDVDAFARRTERFLSARIERNVLATVLANVRKWSHQAPVDAIFALGTEGRSSEPVAVALRTPPWEMLATDFDDRDDARALLDSWLRADPGLSGVCAEPATAHAIALAWIERTGGSANLRLAETMHELSELIPPQHRASGQLRLADDGDRDILVDWERAFSIEARSGDPELAYVRVARRLADGHHYMWEDERPVSMLAHTEPIGGVSRIGPVYTPPQFRRHGYATSAVADLTRLLLDRGSERCMLYTDVSNRVSNHIYASIGYCRFAEWEVFEFVPRAGEGADGNA